MGNFGFRSEMKGALASEDEEKIEAAKKGIKEAAPAYFKDYNQEIDENLLASMLRDVLHKCRCCLPSGNFD